MPRPARLIPACAACLGLASAALSQQVTLPLPRLLTVYPMGGQAGTTVEVAIAGDNLEDVAALQFSTPKITAEPVAGPDGKPEAAMGLVKGGIRAVTGALATVQERYGAPIHAHPDTFAALQKQIAVLVEQ